jgi:hypothetical protein
MKTSPKKMTEQERDLVLRMYLATAPVAWLCEHFNRNESTIRRVINAAGAKRGRVHKGKAPVEQILREAGLME